MVGFFLCFFELLFLSNMVLVLFIVLLNLLILFFQEGGYECFLFCVLFFKNSFLKKKFLKFGWTPLHFAAAKGFEQIVKIFIEHHANVNIQNQVFSFFFFFLIFFFFPFCFIFVLFFLILFCVYLLFGFWGISLLIVLVDQFQKICLFFF